RRHTRWPRDWSSDVCSSDLGFYLTDNLSRVRRPKATTTARAPFTQHEVRQLCLAAYDTRTGQRDLAIIHLLLDTGMRVGGLCSRSEERRVGKGCRDGCGREG